MEAVLLGTILAVFTTMALSLWRALAGPSVYDTIVGVNAFGTKTVLLVALISFFTGHHDLIDVALVYAVSNFITAISRRKLVRTTALKTSGTQHESSHPTVAYRRDNAGHCQDNAYYLCYRSQLCT